MYFAEWLLKRMNKHLFNNWEWVRKYREIIIDEKAMSIILTLLLGLMWVIFSTAIACLVLGTRPSDELLYLIFSIPPLFYIYNWIMALYEIFDRERRETWAVLKETR